MPAPGAGGVQTSQGMMANARAARKGCRHGQGYRLPANAGGISSLKESDRVAGLQTEPE